MSENRLPDYLDHIRQAASEACRFVEGLSKEEFLADTRTQRAVVMSLIIIGEAATKAIDRYPEFIERHPEIAWEKLKNAFHGIFQLASARYTPAPGSVNQALYA